MVKGCSITKTPQQKLPGLGPQYIITQVKGIIRSVTVIKKEHMMFV